MACHALGAIIDPSLTAYPKWSALRTTEWPMPVWSGGNGTVHLSWNANTGEAIVVHSNDF